MKTSIIIFLLVAFVCSAAASAETYRVNPSKANHLQTVMDGLESGDTVIFERGVYKTREALRLSEKSHIKVQGEGRAEIVLDSLDQDVIDVQSCQNVTISGLSARHQTPNKEYACEGAVVSIHDSKQIAVTGCKLNGCGSAGVYASGTEDLVVFDNTIFNNSFAAVWVYNSSGIVHKNRMYGNAADLVTGGTGDITLTGNTIEDNQGNSFNQTDFSRQVMRER